MKDKFMNDCVKTVTYQPPGAPKNISH